MRSVMLVVAVVAGVGCTGAIHARVRESASVKLGCESSQIAVSDGPSEGINQSWFADGCRRRATCAWGASSRSFLARMATGTTARDEEMVCQETGASWARTQEAIVTDRLALETGCSAIEVVGKTEWVRGQEQAFRMNACGKPFVCATAPSGTNCKPALAEGGAQ